MQTKYLRQTSTASKQEGPRRAGGKIFDVKCLLYLFTSEVEQICLTIGTNTCIDGILPLTHYLPLSIASVVDWVETDIDAVCG